MLLYQLARDDLGDAPAAAAGVTLLASYPFSVFHAAVYTESMFLLAVVGARAGFQSASVGFHACLWGALAGLTRPNGVPVVAGRSRCSRSARASGATQGERGEMSVADRSHSVPPIAGAALYWLFLWQFTGNPFQWSEQHEVGQDLRARAPARHARSTT
jgi:hypothetical protein